jgi:tetratricopeptide (TPR) repeat protein
VALRWERLQVPWTIRVPDVTGLWVDAIRRDMRAAPGFSWVHQQAAAQFCLQHDVNLEEALGWARQAANPRVGGQDHFLTLSTLSQLLHATGNADEGAAVLTRAIAHPTADTFALHQFGRTLLARNRLTEAMTVFQTNATRFDGAWPTHVGLMRGYAALGNTQRALEHARKALEQAPDDLNRNNLTGIIGRLEAGQPIG